MYVPTLTEVFASSSDALLPPCLLLVLSRLELLCMPYIALKGRCGASGGEEGGDEVAMPLQRSLCKGLR